MELIKSQTGPQNQGLDLLLISGLWSEILLYYLHGMHYVMESCRSRINGFPVSLIPTKSKLGGLPGRKPSIEVGIRKFCGYAFL